MTESVCESCGRQKHVNASTVCQNFNWHTPGVKGEVLEVARNGVPDSEVDLSFLQGMVNRMAVSFYKYGAVAKAYPHDLSALDSLQQRLDKYHETSNTEFLIDAANFAMIEFMRPSKQDAHYTPTDSDQSPGRTTARGKVTDAPNGDRRTW